MERSRRGGDTGTRGQGDKETRRDSKRRGALPVAPCLISTFAREPGVVYATHVAERTGRMGGATRRTRKRRTTLAARGARAAPVVDRPGSGAKLPFDIDEVMRRVSAAVKDKPKAVLFELAERGY